MAEKHTLYYWGEGAKSFYGRAFAPCMLMMQKGIKEWTSVNKPDDMAPLGGFAVPTVTFPGGYTTSQTSNIVITMGEDFGMVPEKRGDAVQARQVVMDVGDYIAEWFSKRENEEWAKGRAESWYKHFNNLVKTNAAKMEAAGVKSEGYLYGALSYADVSLLSAVELADCYFKGSWGEGCDELKAWFKLMQESDAYKGYMASGIKATAAANRFKKEEEEKKAEEPKAEEPKKADA